MPASIFVVTDGDGCDYYRLMAVFDALDRACEWAQQAGACCIEEYALNPGPVVIPDGHKVWMMGVRPGGQVVLTTVTDPGAGFSLRAYSSEGKITLWYFAARDIGHAQQIAKEILADIANDE